MTPHAAIAHARKLKGRAERHKWAERQNRRRAREVMQELEQFCAAHGITLEIIDTVPRRTQSHEHNHGST